jgi:hypothetical protein
MSDNSSSAESNPVSVSTEPAVAPVGPTLDKAPMTSPVPDPTRYGDWEKNGRCIDF